MTLEPFERVNVKPLTVSVDYLSSGTAIHRISCPDCGIRADSIGPISDMPHVCKVDGQPVYRHLRIAWAL